MDRTPSISRIVILTLISCKWQKCQWCPKVKVFLMGCLSFDIPTYGLFRIMDHDFTEIFQFILVLKSTCFLSCGTTGNGRSASWRQSFPNQVWSNYFKKSQFQIRFDQIILRKVISKIRSNKTSISYFKVRVDQII